MFTDSILLTGVNTPRAPSPQQTTGPTKSVKFTPSVIGSSPERNRHSRRGDGNNQSYEADDSDTTLDDDDRRRSSNTSTSPRRSTRFANEATNNTTNNTSSAMPRSSSHSGPSNRSSRHHHRSSSEPPTPTSPTSSDSTIELPERFDEQGHRRPERGENDDPIASLIETFLDGTGFLNGDDGGEGSSRRDKRRR